MVNRGENLPVKFVEHFRGGDGETIVKDLTAGKKPANVRVCSEMVLMKGCSIGRHGHSDDSEIIYILGGEGVYDDNGTVVSVRAGDTLVCFAGEEHSLRNEKDDPLRYLAMIVAE